MFGDYVYQVYIVENNVAKQYSVITKLAYRSADQFVLPDDHRKRLSKFLVEDYKGRENDIKIVVFIQKPVLSNLGCYEIPNGIENLDLFFWDPTAYISEHRDKLTVYTLEEFKVYEEEKEMEE